MKILVFCPTINQPEKEVLNALLNQKGVEFFDVMLTHDNPYSMDLRESYKNIQLAYNKMRDIALTQGYKKVWVVEHDTIPPDDALAKLLEVDAPIVSGLYALRHGEPVPNLMRPLTIAEGGNGMTWKEIKQHWGETIEIGGGCMGCLLIDASVMKNFSFTVSGNYAPDVSLMNYCTEKKIPQMARLDVLCGHKKVTGEIIYPDKEKGYRIERAN